MLPPMSVLNQDILSAWQCQGGRPSTVGLFSEVSFDYWRVQYRPAPWLFVVGSADCTIGIILPETGFASAAAWLPLRCSLRSVASCVCRISGMERLALLG